MPSPPRSCRPHRGAPRTALGARPRWHGQRCQSAVTSSTDRRLSQARPNLRSSQPPPPPRVNPPTPVVETRPPVVARPYGSVARSRSLMVAPPGNGRRSSLGIDRDGVHPPQVDHKAALREGPARDTVPAAADRDLETEVASEMDRAHDIIHVGALGDDAGPPIDHRVEDRPGLLVGGVARHDGLSGKALTRGRQGRLDRSEWSYPTPFRALVSAGFESGFTRHCPVGLNCRLKGGFPADLRSTVTLVCRAGKGRILVGGPIRSARVPPIDLGSRHPPLASPSSLSLSSGRGNRRSSQAVDPAQDRGDHRARHRHLGRS